MWAFVAQTALAALASASLLFAYRWIRTRAPLAALLFAAGLLARVAAGLGFALTWLGTAPAEVRLGPDARWFPDASMYYEDATDAATYGLTRVGDFQASPVFVRSLALWMRATGQSHGTAHLLNILVFAAIAVGVCSVLTRRGDDLGRRATALVVGVFALSPNLIILASQPLKDTLFFGALAAMVLALWWLLPDEPGRPLRLRAVPLAVVLLGVYLMSGMRTYFGLMVLGLLGAVLGVRALILWRAGRRVPWRFVRASAVLLATVWLGCRVGGGPYYESLVEPVTAPFTDAVDEGVSRVLGVMGITRERPRRPASSETGFLFVVERSRRGFEGSGGGTNMAPPELDRSRRSGLFSHLWGAGLGVAAVFVPVSLLRASGLVSFPGGGGMLLLTDLDTVFIDLAILACAVLVWRFRRDLLAGWGLTTFLVVLGIVSALLVGYVVTNYGTLFRLRLLAVVPFWLLPLALAAPAVAPQRPAAEQG